MRQGWLGTRVTPTPDTAHNLVANIRHLSLLGINQFIIGMSSGVEWSDQTMDMYRQQWEELADFYIFERNRKTPIKIYQFSDSWDTKVEINRYNWGCSGGRNQIAISAIGDIYPCARFLTLTDPHSGERGPYKLGNLDEGMTNHRCHDELGVSFGSCRIRCINCEFADACSGTCPANNYKENQSIFDCSGYLCEENKILLDLIRRRPELCTVGGGEWVEQGVVDSLHIENI